MPLWLQIARGPVFRFAMAILVLGLVRVALLILIEMVRSVRRAGDRSIPYRRVAVDVLKWLLPLMRLHRTRAVYSYASFGLHLGIIFVSLFLQNHIDILEASLGLTWPATYRPLLDALTLVTIVGASILLFYRTYVPSSRRLSGFMDYLLLILILGIYLSGYLAGRPWNPIPYDGLMLFHTLVGVLLIMLIPFTKIAHCVLFPLVRLGSEIAWRLTPRGGSEVIQTLYGPEGRKI